MEENLVGGSSSSIKGSKENTTLIFKHSDIFDKVCPFYMSIGMTYDEYWHGELDLPKIYLEAYKLKSDRELSLANYKAWLNGFYIYEALCDVSPIFNPLSKKHEAYVYRDKPIPVTEKERNEAEQDERNSRLLKLKELLENSSKKEV